MGEFHLEIIVDRLSVNKKLKLFKVNCKLLLKKLLQKPVDAEGKFIKQSGGRGQYGHVWLKMEPLERGKGYEFENKVVGGIDSS